MIIAIDGPAASGKGTLGKRIAAHYGLAHLDTGKLYRAVARDTLAMGRSPKDASAALIAAKALDLATLGDPHLMDGRLGEAASIVASHPDVRQELLAYQRAFARQKPGAVLDGRDIGTVICPDADVKLFVTAAPEERARRRYRELCEAERGFPRPRSWPISSAATNATSTVPPPPWSRRKTRSCSTPRIWI